MLGSPVNALPFGSFQLDEKWPFALDQPPVLEPHHILHAFRLIGICAGEETVHRNGDQWLVILLDNDLPIHKGCIRGAGNFR